jgi:tetraacyldisaccharide 4'-kinase
MGRFRKIARPLLLPFSLLYGSAVLIRNWLYDVNLFHTTRFKIPTISVGNITVGGTGKTPHVEYLIRQLKPHYHLAVLSRGYKRKTKNFVLASENSGVAEIGDEPLQIKQKFPDVPVAVESDRVLGVQRLMEVFPDLQTVLLDDAYQHRSIAAHLSVLLVDYTRPVFQDVLLPAGNLREPQHNICRANIILVTKCPESLSVSEREKFISRLRPRAHQQVFFTCYTYGAPVPVFVETKNRTSPSDPDDHLPSGSSVLLVTGIANPAPLKKYLAGIFDIRKELDFPDHHNFNLNDFKLIHQTFESIEATDKLILVTEKDAVRIRESEFHNSPFSNRIYYIPVEVKFLANCEEPFLKIVFEALRN